MEALSGDRLRYPESTAHEGKSTLWRSNLLLPISSKQRLSEVLHTLLRPIRRRKLIHHTLKRIQRAERLITREMVPRLSTAREPHHTVIEAHAHVVRLLEWLTQSRGEGR